MMFLFLIRLELYIFTSTLWSAQVHGFALWHSPWSAHVIAIKWSSLQKFPTCVSAYSSLLIKNSVFCEINFELYSHNYFGTDGVSMCRVQPLSCMAKRLSAVAPPTLLRGYSFPCLAPSSSQVPSAQRPASWWVPGDAFFPPKRLMKRGD